MPRFESTVQFAVNAQTNNVAVLDDFRKRVDGIGKAAQQSTGGIGALTTGISGLSAGLAPLAALLSAASLISFGRQTLEMAGRLDDASKSTRVAAETLDRYQQVAELAGVSFEQVTGGLAKFNKSIADAASGNEAAADAFGQLGISVKNQDGTLRSTEEVFADFAKRVREAPNDAAIFEQGTILLGRSFANLIPFFQEGTSWIDQFKSRFSKGSIQELADFDDQILRIQKGFGNMGITIVENVVPNLQSLFAGIAETREGIQNFINTNETLETVLDGISAAFINAKAQVKTFKAAIESFGDNASFSQELSRIQKEQQAALKKLSETRTLGSVNLNIAGDLPARGSQFSNTGTESISGAYNAQKEAAKEALERQKELARERERQAKELAREMERAAQERQREAERQRNVISDFLAASKEKTDALRFEISLMGKSREEQEKLVLLREIDNDAKRRSADLSSENAAKIFAEAEATKAVTANLLEEFNAKRNDLNTGIQEGFQDYLADVQDRATAARDAIGNALGGIEDAFVNLATTGKLSFRDLANSIIADIARIAIRQSITGPLAGLLSSAFSGGAGISSVAGQSSSVGGLYGNFAAKVYPQEFGGIMTSDGPLPLNRYALGGIANSPQLALFGEGRTPEAFVPLPDGRRIPVAMKGGGGNTSVVVNVNVDSGAQNVTSTGQNAEALGKTIAAAVRSTIINEKRPGGLLS